ncbi:CCA tRNA nucleotidyltransferase [Paenibacillus sp. D2_2]|uniref:CCA tRNA nucleotidyltransferase n=1 Tax=Paenibacillus sp. D2_2 TaxID=3073092 RepID=UPI002815CFDF|nr:CCA tRNA nucleotidyltransferase [Paenibacillus sp. D2_2]WMT42720.1 CCA tRNA nucleotidyltransferase [Paenibacillus sp. D2_2]
MGREVHDMDIATSARPEQVIALFDRTVPTGIQHGTVMVLMGEYSFEVTTFRKESDYEDHRRPSRVEFVDAIIEDLQRRDFTMNAMALGMDGRLIDPFAGRGDIAAGLIRCVGQAGERFEEDALRMMRAIRFASVFGFRPVKSLWRALLSGKKMLSFIAMERIRAELERVIEGPRPLRGLALIQRSGMIDEVKYPVSYPGPLRENYLRTMEHPLVTGLVKRLYLLLRGLNISADQADSLMRQWTFSNSLVERTIKLIRFDEQWMTHITSLPIEDRKEEQNLRRAWISLELACGRETVTDWLGCHQALLQELTQANSPVPVWEQLAEWGFLNSLLNQAEAWHEGLTVYELRDLAIAGSDVIECTGKKGGPWLGQLMKQLLESVAMGDLINDREALLEHAKDVVNRDGI